MKENAGWGGGASFPRESFDSAVIIVSRVHQTLNTLI